jgi:hypothetical protein
VRVRAVAPTMMQHRDRVVCHVFVSLCEDYTNFCVKTIWIFVDLCLAA